MQRVPFQKTRIWQPKSNAPDSRHLARTHHVPEALRNAPDGRPSFSTSRDLPPPSVWQNGIGAATRGARTPPNPATSPVRSHSPGPEKFGIRRRFPGPVHNKPVPVLKVLPRSVRCGTTPLLCFSTYESTSLRFFQGRLQEVPMKLLHI